VKPASVRSSTLRNVDDLVSTGLVDASQRGVLAEVAESHSVAISPAVVKTITRDPATDPVALQYIPSVRELSVTGDERDDPIGDAAHSPLPGLVHRYPDRVLVKATLVCPVYCRFCFRKTMVGSNATRPLCDEDLKQILGYIAAHPEIWEVILSGGDPLILSPRNLGAIVEGLESIPHVRIVRVHSRVPVVAPEKIDASLLSTLRTTSKTTYVVLHANHASEFSADAREACNRIVDAGIPMLGQSVLLKGVNDTVEALSELMRSFVENRIVPYYLHHLDRAPGTAHFRVSLGEGQDLMKALRGTLSGLCQPTYVLDIPGGHGKSPIGPQ
jgi:lysine 2,3-aminomutase